MSRNGRQATQRAAALFSRVHSGIRMLCLLLIGVIALGVAANAAPAKPRTGPTAVAMEDIVAAGDSVFALAANHQGVYEWSVHQNNWRKVKAAAQKLYAGGGKVYAIEQGTGDITQYGGDPYQWTRIGGPGATFAATSKNLYGISPDHSGVWKYSGRGDRWDKVGGPAEYLYAGPDDALYATNPDDKRIFRYDGTWTQVGGEGATFAVTDNNLYGLTPDHKTVVEYDKKKNVWNPVGDSANDIFAGTTLYKTTLGTEELYKYNGHPYKWTRISGKAADFATSGNHLYRLALDKHSVHKYDGNGANDKWATIGAPAFGPAPSPEEKGARFTNLNQLGDDSRKAWTTARDEHVRGVPDPYEFRWSTNYCNYSRDVPFQEFDFKPACARHDFLSRNYRDMYGENAFQNNSDGQKHIDKILQDDMLDTCKDRAPVVKQLCEDTAVAYYEVVALASQLD
ncbi:phospholipase A2 [Streptomyces sp. NPDC059835]|uniref:phospholipase A2 n=1 Tax=Streptomyces sp. NPDC059835 TaxID=3346967 RepID=UPI00366349EE